MAESGPSGLRRLPAKTDGPLCCPRWDSVYDLAREADRPAFAGLARDTWLPRLERLGFDPRPGETLVDTELRGNLLRVLGRLGDETVAAEARRRFAALATDPKSLDGPLKTIWLGIAARNATAAEWDRLAALAVNAPSAVEQQAYFVLLGGTNDKALAQKALDLALTGKAGTTSAAIIAAVAQRNADLAFDFAIANRAAIEAMLDASGRPTYIAGLAATSRDPAMIGKLESYRATVPADEWREIDRRIAGVRERLATEPRIAGEIGDWLASR